MVVVQRRLIGTVEKVKRMVHREYGMSAIVIHSRWNYATTSSHIIGAGSFKLRDQAKAAAFHFADKYDEVII